MSDENEKKEEKLTQVVVFKVGNEFFAANINSVSEIIRKDIITPIPNASVFISGIINIRGKIVPIINLVSLLNIKDSNEDQSFIILIDSPSNKNDLIGMLVSEIVEISNFPDSNFKVAPKLIKSEVDSEFISSVILPDDEEDKDNVIVYLNLEAIITKSIQNEINKVKTDSIDYNIDNKEKENNENTNS